MPILEYFWLVLGICLYLKQTLIIYTDASRVPSKLSNILLDQSNTSRQKRSTRSNDRVSYKTSQALSGECCPSVTRPIAPLGGISKDGRLLQLFRDTHTIQKFYETECAPQVRDRPCAFIDENKWVSSCTQKYTYTYAIVKDFNVTEPYRIDYMMIKSGCSCTVMEPANQPKTELTDDIFKEDLLNELTADLFGKKK